MVVTATRSRHAPDASPPVGLLSPSLARVAEATVTGLARLITKAWFRTVESQGLDAIAADRPVVVVANHANGFVDPVLLMATSPRPLKFLAKASLWKVPGLRWLLAVAGALPVQRAVHGDTAANRRMFAASERDLALDGTIALFPEGTVNDALRLKPLKTGAARIALGARAEGARALRIVPVGLIYEDKTRPRTRVLVRAAETVELDEVVGFLCDGGAQGPENHSAVDRLTSLLAGHLASAATDYERGAELNALAWAAMVAARPPDADPSRPVPMARSQPLIRRLTEAPAEARETVVAEAGRYRGQLEMVGLLDADVVPGNTALRFERRVNVQAGKGLVLLPFAMVGGALNAVPFAAVKVATLGRQMRPVDVANFRLLASLVAFPVAWTGWALLGRRAGVPRPVLLAFLAGPATGQAAVAFWERTQAVRRARIQWARTRRHEDLLAAIRQEREAVVKAVERAIG